MKRRKSIAAGIVATAVMLGGCVVGVPILALGGLSSGGTPGTCDGQQPSSQSPDDCGTRQPEAGDSVSQDSLARVRGITVHTNIAAQLEALLRAAEVDGLVLTGWGFRSHERQIELRRAHCGTGHYNEFVKDASDCTPPTARPGSSMHEVGLAIDFDSCSSRSTACWRWLDANAAAFGFYNLPSEAWHWSVDGS